MKIFEYVFIIAGIIFIFYVVTGLKTEQGMGAVDNFCQPVQWVGNFSVSISAVIDEHAEAQTSHAFKKMHYDCEYMGWRMFFEKQYLQYKKEQKEERRAQKDGSRARYRTEARYVPQSSINPVAAGENTVNQGAPE